MDATIWQKSAGGLLQFQLCPHNPHGKHLKCELNCSPKTIVSGAKLKWKQTIHLMSVTHVERAKWNYILIKVNNQLYIFGSNKSTNNHSIEHRVQLRNRCFKWTCLIAKCTNNMYIKTHPCSPTVYCFSRVCIDAVFIAVFMTQNKYANAR